MKERKELSFMSDWSNAEQEFVNVIIEIVERKYNASLEKGKIEVKLEEIKIGLNILTEDYVHVMQGIDRSNEPQKTVKRMLGNFQAKEEIKKYSDGFYCLNKKGNLYNHLVGHLSEGCA